MIVRKQARNLREDELTSCEQLTLSFGKMRPKLERILRDNDPKPQVFLYRQNDQILGWTLLFEDGDPTLYMYVDEEYRNMGIGTKLFKRALAYEPDVHVCPWDETSRRFYSALDARPAIGYA